MLFPRGNSISFLFIANNQKNTMWTQAMKQHNLHWCIYLKIIIEKCIYIHPWHVHPPAHSPNAFIPKLSPSHSETVLHSTPLSLIRLSKPTYRRAKPGPNGWFCGNNGLRFVHLTINSLPPPVPEKKVPHSDKARGWTLLNKSFCLTLVDFCFGLCSLTEIYEAVRRVHCQGMMDNMRQKWQEQEKGYSLITKQSCLQIHAAHLYYFN